MYFKVALLIFFSKHVKFLVLVENMIKNISGIKQDLKYIFEGKSFDWILCNFQILILSKKNVFLNNFFENFSFFRISRREKNQ